ncbi:MAG: TMEM165/GDT1 family protein [Alphaproteobacteria bacterium]|nr:TMEM165/GDT1 family protein [Alphaproteobacteria bacterium]
MEAFLVSLSTVAIAEMGDRTQLLSLLLATQFRRPWTIVSGILLATVANHALAGVIGVWIGRFLSPSVLDGLVGASLLTMAFWTLKREHLDESKEVGGRQAFAATFFAFFVAEMGDKTQIATMALAAGYTNLFAVVAGSTTGMMLANIPAVFVGHTFAARLPLQMIRYVASAVFVVLGAVFLVRAIPIGM